MKLSEQMGYDSRITPDVMKRGARFAVAGTSCYHLKREAVKREPCGSIMSGQRLEFETMMPLSMLKLSTGRPAICHALMSTASPSVALSENVGEHGIFLSMHSRCHLTTQSYTSHQQHQQPASLSSS